MFKIYGNPEGMALLRLVPLGTATVRLVCVDATGARIEGGSLMDFHSDGTFSRIPFVTTEGGIQIENKRIKERT
ncbi:hypothetical protein LCGC14_2664060 [marine sediment metagenome]|uniref:Uncharacterized protein n=1 Tax=marine sediment metagenome TaxID=412755 RepID=A0A0F9CHZ4_9ZZZZ